MGGAAEGSLVWESFDLSRASQIQCYALGTSIIPVPSAHSVDVVVLVITLVNVVTATG